MLMEKNWEWGKEIYVAFIDLEKAFDAVPRAMLWEALEDEYYGIGQKLVRVIKSLYIKCQSKVRSTGGESDWFEVRSGVSQGGVISPLLFVLCMDRCMRKIGIMNEEELGITLAYADDVAVVTTEEEALQRALNRWNEILSEDGMKINKTKTEVMMLARNRREIEIEIEQVRLKTVCTFKYLGVTMNDTADPSKEIDSRIDIYSRNVGILYPLLKEPQIPPKVKVLIYSTILRPLLTYGSETWTMTTTTSSRIEAAEMRVLRLIKGVTRMDRMKSAAIREELNVELILKFVERQRLRWYGHLRRMEGNRFPARFYHWQPEGRRPVGRPKKRWREGVEAAVASRGHTLLMVEEEQLFLDRNAWRDCG